MSVLNSFKNDHIGCFRFLIQLLIRMKFYIKFYVRLYKILCSLVFFLTSISFIRYKVTVMVLICFVFRPHELLIVFFNNERPDIQYGPIQHGREYYKVLVIRMDVNVHIRR